MHENPIWPKGHIESICPLGNSIDAWTSCTAQGTYRYACKSRYGVKVLNCHWNCNCIFSMHIVHFHCTLHIFIAHCTFSLHIAHFHCTLYIFTAHCTHSLLILYCCSSSCGTLTAEPLLSNSRVASVKQIVIATRTNEHWRQSKSANGSWRLSFAITCRGIKRKVWSGGIGIQNLALKLWSGGG